MPYMVTFTINIPPMLAYIPYMDPMGLGLYHWILYIYYIICTCIHSDIRFVSQKVVHWIYGATAFVSVLGEVYSHWIHRKGGYFTVDVICTANAFALYYLSTL